MIFFIALDARIVVLIVLFCLQLPFHGSSGPEIRYKYPDGSEEEPRRVPENSEEKVRSLLEQKFSFVADETAGTRYKIAEEYNREMINRNKNKSTDLNFRTSAAAVRRIVGGMETSINMYPYNVAISKFDRHWCGGSIIDEQWVLTAAHCMESTEKFSNCEYGLANKTLNVLSLGGLTILRIPLEAAGYRPQTVEDIERAFVQQWTSKDYAYGDDKTKLQPFVVRAGSSFHNRGGYQAKINAVFFTEKYKPGNADFDYSLMRLDRPLPIGRNIAVLNLPSKNYITKIDEILIVTGWGSTDETGYGHIPDRLRFVPVPLLSEAACQASYRFPITGRMICAGYATGGKDACNHDSGGPAVREGVLLGIVSFGGKRCGDPKSPGVYSKVSEITNWVEDTIINNEANTVPELVPRITKARQREKELERFRAKMEKKRSLLRTWLRDAIKSPRFADIAKKKIAQHEAEAEPKRRDGSVELIFDQF